VLSTFFQSYIFSILSITQPSDANNLVISEQEIIYHVNKFNASKKIKSRLKKSSGFLSASFMILLFI